jgi:photosystem II stability/assembly factor-like uncharacterized protein
VFASAALSNVGCTFYTSCPTDNGNMTPTGNTGGSANQGGKANQGGNANQGGSSAGGDTNTGGSIDTGPAPTGEWENATNDLGKLADGGKDLTVLSTAPGGARVIAGIHSKGLWATEDAGETWTQLGMGAGSDIIDGGPTTITYDPDATDRFWVSGIYGAGALRTDDDGETFEWLGELGHTDCISVDFTDPERKTLLAGPHEETQKLYRSVDGGDNWEDIGVNLPPDTNYTTLPLIIDTTTFLVGSCGVATGKCGVFRSTDGGDSWDIVSETGVALPPLWASDGTIYWTAYGGGMIVSEDLGETWSDKLNGPAQTASPDLLELPDGRIVALGIEYPLATSDKGRTWKRIGGPLPFPGVNCGTYGLTYSAKLKMFFAHHNDCSGVLSEDAVWRLPFDYETE